MTIQITIIGLGQIGSSVGMALAKHKDQILRVGHDKAREAVNLANKNNVVDKVAITLTGAVKDADIILLALPLQEIKPVLEHISQDLKEGALVIDTAPLKGPVLKWAEELLPEKASYVGFTPVIGSKHLDNYKYGPETAAEDIFQGNLMGIVASRNVSEKAINAAVTLAQLLGASPYFSDQAEIDGLMTLTYILPTLLAASLLKVSQDTPGWKEARKVAGKSYKQVSNPFAKDEIAGALAAALATNQDNTTRVINDLIRVLIELRDQAETGDQEKLQEYFTRLQQGRDLWLDDRQRGTWIESPGPEMRREGVLTRLLGFRGPKKPREDR
jgi:prephenate dehydrogenase